MFVFRGGCDLALASAELKIFSKQESGRGCVWRYVMSQQPLGAGRRDVTAIQYLQQIDKEWMSRSLRCECTIMDVGAGVERNREVDR
jgi:hypothetical protein